MKYAIVSHGSTQYKVSEGDVIEIDHLSQEVESMITFPNVLLYVDEGTVDLGTPYVEGMSVVGKVIKQKKGDKLRVAKFKAKARYRRVMGFRAQLTEVSIEGIQKKGEQIKIKENKEEKVAKTPSKTEKKVVPTKKVSK